MVSSSPGCDVRVYLHLISTSGRGGLNAVSLFTLQMAQHPLFCAQAFHGDSVTVSAKMYCCLFAKGQCAATKIGWFKNRNSEEDD